MAPATSCLAPMLDAPAREPLAAAAQQEEAHSAAAQQEQEEEEAFVQRLVQGMQEDMMVALLETVQSAAASCAEICAQRLRTLHKEMIRAVEDAEADIMKRIMLSQKIRNSLHAATVDATLVEMTDAEGTDGEQQAGQEGSIEAMYCDAEWESLRNNAVEVKGVLEAEKTPTPVRRQRPRRRQENRLMVKIDEEHWTSTTARKLVPVLRRLSEKHGEMVIAPVAGRCEIFVKGDRRSIDACKPELANIVMEHFPFAGLPDDLRVEGMREPERLDPSDGQLYTLRALWGKQKDQYSKDEVWAYWETEMQPEAIPLAGTAAGPSTRRDPGDTLQQEDIRPRGKTQGRASLFTRGLREVFTQGGQKGAQPGGGGELKVVLDQAWSPPALAGELAPALERVAQKFEDLRVAPIMGKKGEIFVKGDLRSIEAAKPRLAEVVLKHFPFADLPQSLQTAGRASEEERQDPEDGRTYTLSSLRQKFADRSLDAIWGYWESEMRAP